MPDKLNAITSTMSRNLALATDELARDDNVRVVIVTGAGRGFCSGADVSMMAGGISGGAAETPSRYQRLRVTGVPHYDVFPKLEKPVIAAINGACVGGGLSLATSCDIRIASETAKFLAAQVARGLVPDVGMTHYLPLVAGISTAMDLMTTVRTIDAAEAERLGIVSRVVAADELMTVARELAAKIENTVGERRCIQPAVSNPQGLHAGVCWNRRMNRSDKGQDCHDACAHTSCSFE